MKLAIIEVDKRCMGHCCRSFFLPYSYEMLQLQQHTIEDGEQIAAMVVQLEDLRFTCKHLSDSGDCQIYETRPRMCRDYPYNGECQWEECGLR